MCWPSLFDFVLQYVGLTLLLSVTVGEQVKALREIYGRKNKYPNIKFSTIIIWYWLFFTKLSYCSCGWKLFLQAKKTCMFLYCLLFCSPLCENNQTFGYVYWQRRHWTLCQFLFYMDRPRNFRDVSHKLSWRICILTLKLPHTSMEFLLALHVNFKLQTFWNIVMSRERNLRKCDEVTNLKVKGENTFYSFINAEN